MCNIKPPRSLCFKPILVITAILSSSTAPLIRAEGVAKQHDEPTTSIIEPNQRVPVNRLIVMTVTSDSKSEAFKRFNNSIENYGLELNILESGDRLLSSETKTSSEIDLYKKALKVYKDEQDLVILIVDSTNLIINGDRRDILSRFAKFKPQTKILFAADARCWPDQSLESKYPTPAGGGERFLLSAAFIGYAPALWELLNLKLGNEISHSAQDRQPDTSGAQLYFTQAYLDQELRSKLAIELDHRGELFQNLHSVQSDVELEFDTDGVKLKNLAYLTEPVVVYGTGASRVVLNSLGNYLGRAWTANGGCGRCNETMTSLASTKDSELPTVLIGLFIEEPTPFLDEFFNSIHDLSYPKNKIHIFLHTTIEYHDEQVESSLDKFGTQYASKQVIKSYDNSSIAESLWRTFALTKCIQLKCDHYLALDSVARLDLPETLRLLIEANKPIVAPLLTRPSKLWSNFWGALTADGYYARSHDYVDLVKRDRIGLWNVPHITNAYLLNGNFIREHMGSYDGSGVEASSQVLSTERDLIKLAQNASALIYHDPNLPSSQKPVLVFTQRLRSMGQFQYMLNTHEFGHLVDPTNYNISLKHPEFYQLKNNMLDWEQRYLHDNYSQIFENDTKLEQPCQDVIWFPLVSDLFCKEMIEIMENFGQWSGGTNHDPRIEGGYESVPTRDIHMKQVGLHEMWLTFLTEYIMPVQLKEFIGYEHDPPRADLAFVVRYHPAEQASLRPHHDSSTYTLNIALNSPHVDYEGGGCRFVRYNCSVIESRKGWALIHPGRLTHYHEGLPVTHGTRYIMVTFVDP